MHLPAATAANRVLQLLQLLQLSTCAAPVGRGVAAAPAVLPGVDQLPRVLVGVVCCQRLPRGGVQAHACHALGAVGGLLAAHVLPASIQ